MNANGHEAEPSHNRDVNDQKRLRHARDRESGFQVGRYLQPPPMLFTRDGHNVFLGDMYRGATAFLICAGPSLKHHDLSLLTQRGLLTAAVNNAASVHRPNMWITVDDPGNFCEGLWRDPGMLKFTPLCHMEKPFQIRNEQGDLTPSQEVVGDMPSVFGYRRNEAFRADQYLYEDTFNWGNHGDRTDSLGVKGSRSVFLVALRMLFFLGIRTINLIGCDFKMRYRAANYAFDQARSRSSVNGNNATYRALNKRLEQLLPYFEKEGMRIFNCTPDSGLSVFPMRTYEEAVEAAAGIIPKLQTEGMYDRAAKQKATVRSSVSLASANPAEGIPDFTLVTAVSRRQLNTLKWTWETWRQNRPELFEQPPIVMHTADIDSSSDLEFTKQENPQFVSVELLPGKSDQDAWTQAWFEIPAANVKTDWWLKLEAETVCTHKVQWLSPDWFEVSEGAETVMAAHQWGYSKPVDIFDSLSEWADKTLDTPQVTGVDLNLQPETDRVRYDAISSWFLMARTDWTQKASHLIRTRPPSWNFDALAWLIAMRTGASIIRTNMKRYGWEHSFSNTWNPMRVCRKVLNSNVEVDAK